jgi:hypothetical protein
VGAFIVKKFSRCRLPNALCAHVTAAQQSKTPGKNTLELRPDLPAPAERLQINATQTGLDKLVILNVGSDKHFLQGF